MDIIDGATQGNEGDALRCIDRKPPGFSLPLTAGKRNKIQDLGTDKKVILIKIYQFCLIYTILNL